MADAVRPADEELVALLAGDSETPVAYPAAEIECQKSWMVARDGVRLATDVHLPPGGGRLPAIVVRTPYGRRSEELTSLLRRLAQHGYAAVAQDCRGTGESEPDSWDCYVYEQEDSADCVDWVASQRFSDGFVGGAGGSYLAGTQWAMASSPRMSAIAPEVGGIGGRNLGVSFHMLMNAYARSVGKGAGREQVPLPEMERAMVAETLAGGYYDEPLDPPLPAAALERYPELSGLALPDARRELWERYCALPAPARAVLLKDLLGAAEITLENLENLPPFFGHSLHPDRHLTPVATDAALFAGLRAPALILNGWYDWGINITMRTWELLKRHAPAQVRERSRLLIDPAAHAWAGYHEGEDPSLRHLLRGPDSAELLLRWYDGLRGVAAPPLPRATYYLMGGGGWWAAEEWPPPGVREERLHLVAGGGLTGAAPEPSPPDVYAYDPADPTPTVAGSFCSYVYRPGSGDVAAVQRRPDVLVYTSEPLAADLDVVGSPRCVLYASSSARDTDFYVRLSDVFPDGRAIHLQNGVVRARFRDPERPAPLEPGRPYRFEIEIWATANRFAKGHRLRIDVSSADFPRFDRNANRAGAGGAPVAARQTIYHDPERPSHVVLPVLG